MVSGSLLINKQVGLTSRQEVNNVSRIFNERKAGHIGTLDPFADGLLIVNLGRNTKISQFLEGMDKTYIATLKLGQKTDTGDLTGEVIEEKKVPQLNEEKISQVLSSFLGEQNQLPPMYSAIKIQGKELYKYAREGKTIERKERKVNIKDIKLISFSNNLVVFQSKVSKGTYIRTLAEDIAEKLGTVGHLTKLSRIEVGPYKISDSVCSKNVTEKDLRSVEQMLAHFPSLKLTGNLLKQVENGMHVKLDCDSDEVLLFDGETAIAVYKKEPNGYYSSVRGLK